MDFINTEYGRHFCEIVPRSLKHIDDTLKQAKQERHEAIMISHAHDEENVMRKINAGARYVGSFTGALGKTIVVLTKEEK